MSNATDATQLMAREYPGGIPSIAPRLGTTPEVLRKELSSAQGHKLGLERAMLIADLCREAGTPNCNALANVVAGNHGTLLALPVREMSEPQSIPAAVSTVMQELSDVTSETMLALTDGNVTDNELARIRAEALQAVAAIQRLIVACDAVNQASKPQER